MQEKAKELRETYEELHEEAKHSLKGLQQLIEKNSMSLEDVVALIDNKMQSDEMHPELKSIEEMTSEDYAKMYKKMAEDIKTSPENFEEHIKASGMSADELELLFSSIHGTIEKYPEVWEAKKNAQLLHPKHLAILASGFDKKY